MFSEENFQCPLPSMGWKRRLPHGTTCREHYSEKYVDEIRKLFERGTENSS